MFTLGGRSTGSDELTSSTVGHVSSACILGVEDMQNTFRQAGYVEENSRDPKIEPVWSTGALI